MNFEKDILKLKWLFGILVLLCLIFCPGQNIYAYDARDDGIVTAAKHQGTCNSCWAFASVGAFESHLLKFFSFDPDELDLSEQQQVSCNSAEEGCCGSYGDTLQFWEDRFPIYEDCFPYVESDTRCPTERTIPCLDSVWCHHLPFHVRNYHEVDTSSIAQVKNSLYNFGPTVFGFYVYDDFKNGDDQGFWFEANPGDVYLNSADSSLLFKHWVLIIGWDDTKAAYLCKNSWGAAGGPNGDGTFWIAYDGHAHDLESHMSNFEVVERKIISAEYFVDTDPGEGNGISLSAIDGSFDSTTEEVDLSIDTSELTIGVHTLFIRMQNEEGLWGTPRKLIFEVTGQKTISEAEYFIDSDPGEGNGTAMSSSDGSFDQAIESVIEDVDTSGLSAGLHTIYVRMKDSENHWGTHREYMFEVREPAYLTTAEFYIDDDPGAGSGKPLEALDGTFDSPFEDMAGSFKACGLTAGTHTLYVRAADSYFRWGDPLTTEFDITVPVVECECDINQDGRCDMQDWLKFGEEWGRTDCDEMDGVCECDLNFDCSCDMQDWLKFGEDWGRTDCPVP